MPTAVTQPSNKSNSKVSSNEKGRSPARKRRVVRRRGRRGSFGSDDEIERELGTDSESDEDASSIGSVSDSDTEFASEDVVTNGQPGKSPSNDKPASKINGKPESFFASSGNWSEMVADETNNGPAELPVIDFADFDGKASVEAPSRPKKSQKIAKTQDVKVEIPKSAPSPPSVDTPERATEEPEATPSTSQRHNRTSSISRPPGQTARQAYQNKLESDPSYVPTVGGFWGHDDRLLDKDLRSLSGWWRGRWQNRGRGRGFAPHRGRGGMNGSPASPSTSAPADENLPPIERTWGHDGFEEMKQREEHRRAQRPQRAPQPPPATPATPATTATPSRGGRAVGGLRGGARGGSARGGFTGRGSAANSGRIWYQQKPELMWTKQSENFLYFEHDPGMKRKPGQGTSIHVKIPGKEGTVVKSARVQIHVEFPSKSKNVAEGGEEEERVYAVRLPKPSSWKAIEVKKPEAKKVETPLEEVFTVRPSLVQTVPIPLPEPGSSTDAIPAAAAAATATAPSITQPTAPPLATAQSQPTESVRAQLEQITPDPGPSQPLVRAQTEEAVLKNPSTESQPEQAPTAEATSSQAPPPPPAHPNVYTPPVQPSPVYGSPYAYPPALPPGIALNQHGVPYELATGRPVYLPPPPPPLYNPRPVMHTHTPSPSVHNVPFMPNHIPPHSAVSPDFHAQQSSQTPPMNGFIDPMSGAPIFSFPRQSRIEIRAPSGPYMAPPPPHPEAGPTEVKPVNPKSPMSPPMHRTSSLRTSAASFEPSSRQAGPNGYFPSHATPEPPSYAPVEGSEGAGYQYHQQQYYYPQAYYNPYMDMSQAGQYEVYPPDGYAPPPPQGPVYY